MNRNIDVVGRIVIPKEIRKKLDIRENDKLNIECKDNSIILTKAENHGNNGLLNELEKWIDEQWTGPGATVYVGDIVKKIIELKEDKYEINRENKSY